MRCCLRRRSSLPRSCSRSPAAERRTRRSEFARQATESHLAGDPAVRRGRDVRCTAEPAAVVRRAAGDRRHLRVSRGRTADATGSASSSYRYTVRVTDEDPARRARTPAACCPRRSRAVGLRRARHGPVRDGGYPRAGAALDRAAPASLRPPARRPVRRGRRRGRARVARGAARRRGRAARLRARSAVIACGRSRA